MTFLIAKIDYFQVLSMVQSIFIRLEKGKKVTAILRRWSSRGLGTPEVKITSVSVPAFTTPRQNVYACARLCISGLFFSHTFQSKSPARFILCAACGSVVLLYAARVFDYFVVIEIAFMDNQAQITETISRLDSEKVS